MSSGELFRYHLRQGTPLGQLVAKNKNHGLLGPGELTIDIILDKVLALTPKGLPL